MQRKILTSIILVCLLGIILFIFIFLKKESQVFDNVAYDAIPSNTAVIVEIKNLERFSRYTDVDNSAWKTLSAFAMVDSYNAVLRIVDSVFTAQPSTQCLASNSVIIAVQQIGRNKLEYLFIMPLRNEDEIDLAQLALRTMFSADSLSSYLYDGKAPVHTFFKRENSQPHMSFSITKQTLIISASRVLVETAVRNMYAEYTLSQNPSFAEVKRTAGNRVDANIFINLEQISQFAHLFAHPDKRNVLTSSSDLGSWSELDVNVYSNYVLLNGFASVSDDAQYFSVFQRQTPVPFALKEVLPAGTSTFLSFGIRDKHMFMQRYEQYLKRTNRFIAYEQRIQQINSQLSAPNMDPVRIKQLMYDIIDNEIAMVYGNVNSLDVTQNTFAVLKVRNQSQARETLLGVLDGFAEKTNKKISDFTTTYRIDEKIVYSIYEMPVAQIPFALWGTAFRNANATHFTFIENYVVFGNSVSSLSKFIHAYELKKTLENDVDFRRFSQRLLQNYTVFLYSNVNRSYDLYPFFVSAPTRRVLQTESDELKKFEAFAFQISAERDVLYNHLYVNYNPDAGDKPRTVWESYLDTVVIIKPRFIDNFHTREKNIMVQDAHNNLYLLNRSGIIQWKRQLREPIISEIFEVDYFKNGRIQYVFNTKNYIYMIDRIGNFVDRYPIKLESEATAGLAVFDYENNRNYRIFIPCANRRVYLYSQEGNVVRDWSFGRTETAVTTPIQYFRIDGKDYIVFADENKMYLLNRRGEQRITVKEQIQKSAHNSFIFEVRQGNVPHRFVTTNKKGEVVYIDLQGNVIRRSVANVSPNHYFEYRDMNNNGTPDYIFLDKKKLQVIAQTNRSVFTYTFDNEIENPLALYNFGRNVYKIGVVDVKDSKVYLLNGNGTLHEGFPLKGRTLFSIGFLYPESQTFNLIIGGDNHFLYNYEVK